MPNKGLGCVSRHQSRLAPKAVAKWVFIARGNIANPNLELDGICIRDIRDSSLWDYVWNEPRANNVSRFIRFKAFHRFELTVAQSASKSNPGLATANTIERMVLRHHLE